MNQEESPGFFAFYQFRLKTNNNLINNPTKSFIVNSRKMFIFVLLMSVKLTILNLESHEDCGLRSVTDPDIST